MTTRTLGFCCDHEMNTDTRQSKRVTKWILSTDVTLVKTRFNFFNLLLSKQVTVGVDQVEGKEQQGTVCAVCYMLYQDCTAEQNSCSAKICRSGKAIPRLLWYPLSCNSSPQVPTVSQMNPVNTLPFILFKIQHNLYTLIYAQVFQVFSSLQPLKPKFCMNA
jgi:hypothetical protein